METLLKCASVIDRQIDKLCRSMALLALVLVAAIVLQVLLRYVFSATSIKLEELQWHLYGVLIMMGLSYCQIKDSHVRADVLRHRFSPTTTYIIEIFGTLFLLLPFFVVIFLHSIDYFIDALLVNESSDAPSGLPFRWMMKAFIPFGFILMFFACMSTLIKSCKGLLEIYTGKKTTKQ